MKVNDKRKASEEIGSTELDRAVTLLEIKETLLGLPNDVPYKTFIFGFSKALSDSGDAVSTNKLLISLRDNLRTLKEVWIKQNDSKEKD